MSPIYLDDENHGDTMLGYVLLAMAVVFVCGVCVSLWRVL